MSSTPTIFFSWKNYVAFWLVVRLALIFLRFACHVLHIENLRHILGEDEWFVFTSNIFEVHYCHSIPVYRYTATCSVHTLASVQRNLQGAIVKLSYFLYEERMKLQTFGVLG